ncbi:MAG TPA: hypothetical protein VHU18_13935 [Rhizomicrobium sp.]|jgi:hypothetical protein|nr:hypothetical protein [Rhizomicrobium sp.]
MKLGFGICIGVVLLAASSPAFAVTEECTSTTGDVVLQARTPEVDLFDAPSGKKVMTLEQAKFPACAPITGRAPNFMLQVSVNGGKYWVPPYMVRYRFSGKLPAVCRNLALGSNEQKVGSTRGLGEGCPKAAGAH